MLLANCDQILSISTWVDSGQLEAFILKYLSSHSRSKALFQCFFFQQYIHQPRSDFACPCPSLNAILHRISLLPSITLLNMLVVFISKPSSRYLVSCLRSRTRCDNWSGNIRVPNTQHCAKCHRRDSYDTLQLELFHFTE